MIIIGWLRVLPGMSVVWGRCRSFEKSKLTRIHDLSLDSRPTCWDTPEYKFSLTEVEIERKHSNSGIGENIWPGFLARSQKNDNKQRLVRRKQMENENQIHNNNPNINKPRLCGWRRLKCATADVEFTQHSLRIRRRATYVVE